MQVGALAAYEQSLTTGAALHLRHADGQLVRLEVERWLASADAVDLDVVRRTVSPVLDVGCGPGRIVAALSDHGRLALGIDLAATAVRLTRDRGQNALRADVFAKVPFAGRWRTILLLDGNIGIGADPDRLLTRVRSLLAADGLVIVETHPDPDIDEVQLVRFVLSATETGPEFRWRYVGSRALRAAAARCGLDVREEWTRAGRTFAVLHRSGLDTR